MILHLGIGIAICIFAWIIGEFVYKLDHSSMTIAFGLLMCIIGLLLGSLV